MMKCTIILCLLVISGSKLKAQSHVDLRIMQDLGHYHQHEINYLLDDADKTNELKWMLKGFFIFYKKYISSQDGNSCSFTPSCSEYSIQAIQQKGVIVGGMATFDRLTRCNGLSPEKYKLHPEKKLLIDPVL